MIVNITSAVIPSSSRTRSLRTTTTTTTLSHFCEKLRGWIELKRQLVVEAGYGEVLSRDLALFFFIFF